MVNCSGLPKSGNKECLLKGAQVEQGRRKSRWGFYVISGLGFLLTVLLLVAVLYFREEIQHAQGYGYASAFLVSVLGGVTVMPAPSLVVIFTLGRVLKPVFGPEYVGPVYVGLISGLGEALGGITVYLTGAGVETMWSRFQTKEQAFEHRLGLDSNAIKPVKSQFWSKGEAFYNRLVGLTGRRGSSWILFIVSAVVFSPFYFAGLAAGTLRMGLLRFFLLSWAGKTIKGLSIAFVGYGGLYFLPRWIGG